MTSFLDLKREFRLHTEIYSANSFKEALDGLKISRTDIIITNKFIIEKADFKDALVIDLDNYGRGEPKDTWVNEILKVTNAYEADRVIAIGGGATIDIAKFCTFADKRDVDGLFENKNDLKKKRELIIMPTTCGTGSEVTSVAVIERSRLASKQGLQLDEMFPDIAILVDDLLSTLPLRNFYVTSIDALSHAIESLLSPKANRYTDVFAKEAIHIIVKALMEANTSKRLPKDMGASLIGANMAGIAFSIAGCATMHALSFPIGAKFHLVHGEAVYSVMAMTLRYYEEKGIDISKLTDTLKDVFEVDKASALKELLEVLETAIKRPDLKAMGMTQDDAKWMGESVYENQQRLLVNSPVVLNSKDLTEIYKNCLN